MPPLFMMQGRQSAPPSLDNESGEITPDELNALLDRMNANHQALMAAILAPKRVIRDDQGRVAGVETV
jgi:hypothetical protein